MNLAAPQTIQDLSPPQTRLNLSPGDMPSPYSAYSNAVSSGAPVTTPNLASLQTPPGMVPRTDPSLCYTGEQLNPFATGNQLTPFSTTPPGAQLPPGPGVERGKGKRKDDQAVRKKKNICS